MLLVFKIVCYYYGNKLSVLKRSTFSGPLYFTANIICHIDGSEYNYAISFLQILQESKQLNFLVITDNFSNYVTQ